MGRRIASAIGSAACAFDPVFDVDLHAIQLGIVHLLSLFPVSDEFAAERVEYNRITRSAFERIRDFQSAFYALNRFGAAGFWAKAREGRATSEVAHKIAIFRARGDIAPMEDESFAQDLWQALFRRARRNARELAARDRPHSAAADEGGIPSHPRLRQDKVLEQPNP